MERMGSEMIRRFAGALHRDAPRNADWHRFYDFVVYAHARGRRDAFLPEDVRTALIEKGLTDSQAGPFVNFYVRALDLLTFYDMQTG